MHQIGHYQKPCLKIFIPSCVNTNGASAVSTLDERTPSAQQELEEIIEEEEVLDREEILSRCREAVSEQEKLKTQNQHLQHKLAEYLARKKVGLVEPHAIVTVAK